MTDQLVTYYPYRTRTSPVKNIVPLHERTGPGGTFL
jgi:hypothetical protein